MSGQCCETIYSGWMRYACSRKGTVERKGRLYCKQHDPEAVTERREKRDEEWRKKWAEETARNKAKREHEALKERALVAIKAIAEGHDDPRALAMQVLASEGAGTIGKSPLSLKDTRCGKHQT